MALVLQMLYNGLNDFSEKHRDTRIDHYPLLGSPFKIFTLTAVYILFVKKIGPKFMQNRRPYDIKNVMLVYNIFQVLGNLTMIYMGTRLLMHNPGYKDWSCMTIDRAKDVHDVLCCYLYYILKVIDYMDTIFMVLRKNFKQISFLHLYHHILMGTLGYVFARYFGGGHAFMLGYVNCYVHAVMYAYYFVSALRPGLKASLWWKKYITQLQIAQFLLLAVHFSRVLLNPNCDQPRFVMAFALLQDILMVILFSNFYIKTYIKPQKPKQG